MARMRSSRLRTSASDFDFGRVASYFDFEFDVGWPGCGPCRFDFDFGPRTSDFDFDFGRVASYFDFEFDVGWPGCGPFHFDFDFGPRTSDLTSVFDFDAVLFIGRTRRT